MQLSQLISYMNIASLWRLANRPPFDKGEVSSLCGQKRFFTIPWPQTGVCGQTGYWRPKRFSSILPQITDTGCLCKVNLNGMKIHCVFTGSANCFLARHTWISLFPVKDSDRQQLVWVRILRHDKIVELKCNLVLTLPQCLITYRAVAWKWIPHTCSYLQRMSNPSWPYKGASVQN